MMRIALIGFKGSGKSTVGRRLSKHLSVPIIEIDEFISRYTKSQVRLLFDKFDTDSRNDEEVANEIIRELRDGTCKTEEGA